MKESLLVGLVQPDRRSCGAAALVAAQMLLDPAYADHVTGAGPVSGFARETLTAHRRVTGILDASGAPQLPWPRFLGTPPWALTRRMSTFYGPDLAPVDHDTRLVLGNRERMVARIADACAAGRPVPIYVGDRWLPRHIVLAVRPGADGLEVYDPARGRVTPVRTSDFVAATLPFGRWRRPWFVVLPDAPG